MALDHTSPNPAIVLDLIEAFRRSKSMFAAVELGIFDSLESGPHTPETLATNLNLNPDALGRLLTVCVGLGLLSFEGGAYHNTPAASAYLVAQSPRQLTGYIRYSNDVMWKMWGNLEGAIREGTHRWKETYGWDEPIFSSFFRTPEAKREFLMGMHGFGVLSSPAVANALDFSRFAHLADLGGATGHLAVAMCRRYPNLKATVFDLPTAVPLAHEIVSETEVAERITIVGGDFFQDELPNADLYALGRIVHDWSPTKIGVLLRKIFAALPPGGGLLICEKILNDDQCGPSWAQSQHLNMLLVTEGRERTLSEYDALLMEVGFTQVQACRTGTPIDAILAIKPMN